MTFNRIQTSEELTPIDRAQSSIHAAALVAPPAARAENLALLGSMTAGVAHDLRNILHGISLHVQFLQRSPSIDAAECLSDLRGAVTTGVELVDQLVRFGSVQARTKQEVRLDALAHEACTLARMRARPAGQQPVGLREAHGPSSPVMAWRADVVSAVLNLVINAVDSMPRGGTVEVATGSNGQASWIRVADEGCGVPEALRRHIFEPFFTTKGDAGTGIGLSQVQECAQRHGGTVSLASERATGSAFTLWLPGALAA
jgi:signal transduction histidine kinase